MWGEHFQQTDNIIYTESTWNPIGNATTSFDGTYYGSNWTITFTQQINVTNTQCFGLFGCVSLWMDCPIREGYGDTPSIGRLGVNWQGGLNVDNRSFSGESYVGGLIGQSVSGKVVRFCYTEGTITTNNVDYIGGIIGNNVANFCIYDCYSKTIINLYGGWEFCAGIAGGMGDGIINKCYFVGNINVIEDVLNPIYAMTGNGGGSGTQQCFFREDYTTYYFPEDYIGTPLTLDEMKVKSLYTDAGWDFTYWAIDETNKLINDGLPYISGFLVSVSGSGTEQDKFKISDEGGLSIIATQSMIWNCHFEQTANIEYTDNAWNPIGNATTPFTGSYDGGGHNIKFTKSVLIEGNAGSLHAGLFGYISGSTISNLGVDWAGTDYISINENQYKGLVVLMPDGSSDCGAGGIVGRNEESNIQMCYNIGNVTVYGGCAGGIVGTGNGVGHVYSCYNRGDITAIEPNVSSGGAGGIVGRYTAIASVHASYNTGSITVKDSNRRSVYGIGGGMILTALPVVLHH